MKTWKDFEEMIKSMNNPIEHEMLDAWASEVADLRTQLAAKERELEQCAKACFEAGKEIGDLRSENARLREALEKLARLGNEPYCGNSIGNEIAKQALQGGGGFPVEKVRSKLERYFETVDRATFKKDLEEAGFTFEESGLDHYDPCQDECPVRVEFSKQKAVLDVAKEAVFCDCSEIGCADCPVTKLKKALADLEGGGE